MFAVLAAVSVLALQSAVEPAAPSATIALPAGASRIDKLAAAELQRCLSASLGWKVEISQGPAAATASPVFFVGSLESQITQTPGCPSLPQDKLAALTDEGVWLKGADGKVVLTGKGPRGGLCAVYTFLEEFVGCHWPEPGREYIPKRAELKLEFDHTNNPAFHYRGVALHGPCGPEFFGLLMDWLARNRMNGFQVFSEHYDELRPGALNAILDRGLRPNVGAHSRQYFYPSEKYFPLHPAYFALVKGERTGDTQLCYSNHGSIAEYAAHVIAYLKANPEISMIGLWPSDGYGFCECAACKSRQTTDVILDYINHLAQAIHEQVPAANFEFLSYIDYTNPPEKVKPLDYVVPTYCEYWSRNQFHPITANLAENATCRSQLEGWVKRSREVTLFSYYGDDYIKKFLYNPVPDVVVADLEFYRRIGVSGNFVLLTNPEKWWSQAPHVYAYARAAWDSRATLERISAEYFAALYGPAAVAMKAHQEAARALFETEFGHGLTGEDTLFNFRIGKFNPAHEESSRKQFDEAVARMRRCLAEARSTTAEPYVLNKIRILDQDAEFMGLIYGILSEEAGYKQDQDEVRKARMRELIQRACANEIAVSEDSLRHLLRALNGHVKSVLGPEEAKQYARPTTTRPG